MKLFSLHSSVLLFFSLVFFQGMGQIRLVKNGAEFNKASKNLKAGDSLILKNGIWKDVQLLAMGAGSEEKPIVVMAETPGKVIVTGNSNLRIAGSYVTVKGLWFKHGTTSESAVVSFKKDNDHLANHCRLTDCTISNYNPKNNNKYYYAELWGKHNRIDHNNLTGKTNRGTTLVVWLKGKENIENHHRIDHNYFGERPPLGQNGGETIRIGTSTNSESSSFTTVENNFFQKCNGEIEIVSNKSCDNTIKNNLFLECEGTLTLRHGDRALVEGNVFLGNNKPETGGIRIINQGHTVINNLMVGLTGSDYRAPIAVMNGVPNSPLNRYKPVKNVIIQNNTLINCGAVEFGVGKDEEKSISPTGVVFANNLITNSNGGKIMKYQGSLRGIKFSGNIVNSTAKVNPNYFTKAKVNWKTISSLPVPTADNLSLQKVQPLENSPKKDITGALRKHYVAGAFNLNTQALPEAINMSVGPSYEPTIEKVKIRKDSLTIAPGTGTLQKALSKSSTNTEVYLKPGTYYIDNEIRVEGNIKIIGLQKGKTVLKIAPGVKECPLYFFRIKGKSRLLLKNLVLDAAGDHVPKYAVVSPSEGVESPYSLFVDGCTFSNFTNRDGGSIYKAYQNTFADTVSFKNSRLENSYRGLNLSYQKDNAGKVNAQVIEINNTAFKDIEEYAIDFYCEGPGCKNNQAKLVIANAVFSNIYNEDGGKIVKTKGIYDVEISNTVFERSFNIEYPVKLVGKKSFIHNSVIYDGKAVKTVQGAQEKNVLFKKPRWKDEQAFIPSDNSYLLKKNNGRGRIGLTPKK